ncbi:OPSX-like protein, partial [Mya arenaria]
MAMRKHDILSIASIISRTVSDVGMCLSGHWMIIVSSFTQAWQFKRAGCVYYGFATTMFGITQISLLAAIAIDRFVIIVKPRGFAFSKSKAIAAVILCYIIGCLWAMFPAVGWSSYQLEGIRVRCAINWRSKRVADVSFTLSALILAWMVPLFVIVVSYAGIFHRLQREQTTKFRQSLKQRSSRLKRDRKMAITVLLMIGK